MSGDRGNFPKRFQIDPRLANETERVRQLSEKEAPSYDRRMRLWEKILFKDGRQWVCSRASGEVLEVAIGTGRNLPFYPETAHLTGIELSPAMLKIARERAESLGADARLIEGDAQQLPFQDGSFDTVVSTLSLCSIPDDRLAVSEMKRVLKPGGLLLLLDHVRASSRFLRAVQRALEPFSVRFSGDHLLRRPLEHVLEEGFQVEERERYKWGVVERISARKPTSTEEPRLGRFGSAVQQGPQRPRFWNEGAPGDAGNPRYFGGRR